MLDPNYKQEANIPLIAETHGGEDVAIFATGIDAYLVQGLDGRELDLLRHGRRASLAAKSMRLVFMGTPKAAVPSLERLLDDGHEIAAVYTQPDRPSGRGNKVTFSPVKEFALDRGLRVIQPLRIKTPEALEQFTSFAADAVIVTAYGRILPETFLRAFPKGAINVHFSLLPKYRGAAPVNWAIVNGERTTGVTTMRMDVGLDTGDILLVRETEIGDEENAAELMDRLSLIGADLLAETLARLDSITPRPQDDGVATFAPIMKREDGLVDWSRDAREIVDRVRGFQPFPGSFTSFKGSKVTIWKAKALSSIASNAGAGEVISAAGDELVIAAGGNSAVAIYELQLEGKRRMTTRDVLNGTRIVVGDLFE